MTEADLAALGILRIPIPVPFPQAGGPVNAYVLEEDGGGLAMFDAGLGSPDGERALAEGFARAGRRLEDVRRIVLSHGHVDHYGAARTVVERAPQAEVFVHDADRSKVAESGWRWKERFPQYAAHLARLGVPPEEIAEIAKVVTGGAVLARRLPEVRSIGEGDVVRTRALRLEVLHLPGHTPGMVCLWEPERRLLLSADHLLEKVSPNPLIDLGPDGEAGAWRPLVSYLASLERVRALDVALVLPGHGAPFAGHRAVIDGLVAFYGKRQARIREALADGARSGWEVTRALFPNARAGDLFLAISEAVANVEVLESRGEVVREERAGGWRWRLAA